MVVIGHNGPLGPIQVERARGHRPSDGWEDFLAACAPTACGPVGDSWSTVLPEFSFTEFCILNLLVWLAVKY